MHFEIPRRLYLFKKGILDEIYLLFFPPDLCSFLLSPSSPCWLSSCSLHGSLTSFSSHWIIGSLTSFPCLKKGAPTSGFLFILGGQKTTHSSWFQDDFANYHLTDEADEKYKFNVIISEGIKKKHIFNRLTVRGGPPPLAWMQSSNSNRKRAGRGLLRTARGYFDEFLLTGNWPSKHHCPLEDILPI